MELLFPEMETVLRADLKGEKQEFGFGHKRLEIPVRYSWGKY